MCGIGETEEEEEKEKKKKEKEEEEGSFLLPSTSFLVEWKA